MNSTLPALLSICSSSLHDANNALYTLVVTNIAYGIAGVVSTSQNMISFSEYVFCFRPTRYSIQLRKLQGDIFVTLDDHYHSGNYSLTSRIFQISSPNPRFQTPVSDALPDLLLLNLQFCTLDLRPGVWQQCPVQFPGSTCPSRDHCSGLRCWTLGRTRDPYTLYPRVFRLLRSQSTSTIDRKRRIRLCPHCHSRDHLIVYSSNPRRKHRTFLQ